MYLFYSDEVAGTVYNKIRVKNYGGKIIIIVFFVSSLGFHLTNRMINFKFKK